MSEVSNRRFVHFNGTKQEFKSTDYPSIYNDSVVFINGDGNENKNTIYTHGEYYGNGGIITESVGNSSAIQEIEVSSFTDESPYSSTKEQSINTEASGTHSVVLNGKSNASAKRSFAHGNRTIARGENSHTEGHCTVVEYIDETNNGYGSHAEGYGTVVSGTYAHAEGNKTQAKAANSHSEGYVTTTTGIASHAEGYNTISEGEASHAEGNECCTYGNYSHVEGYKANAEGEASHAEGNDCTAYGDFSHAEGYITSSNGWFSHAEGELTITQGRASHAEGYKCFAHNDFSHAEGNECGANGRFSHAEGYKTSSNGESSHAEGNECGANGNYSHGEGWVTQANGDYSHAEGQNTRSIGTASHSEGNNTDAKGMCSHAEGVGTQTHDGVMGQHAEGYYNFVTDSIMMVGCGNNSIRRNAMEVTQDGRLYIKDIGGYDGTNVTESSDVVAYISKLPSEPIPIKYWDLMDLGKNNKLIPGQKYIIVDYNTNDAAISLRDDFGISYWSHKYRFCIITEALSTNVLSHDCIAFTESQPIDQISDIMNIDNCINGKQYYIKYITHLDNNYNEYLGMCNYDIYSPRVSVWGSANIMPGDVDDGYILYLNKTLYVTSKTINPNLKYTHIYNGSAREYTLKICIKLDDILNNNVSVSSSYFGYFSMYANSNFYILPLIYTGGKWEITGGAMSTPYGMNPTLSKKLYKVDNYYDEEGSGAYNDIQYIIETKYTEIINKRQKGVIYEMHDPYLNIITPHDNISIYKLQYRFGGQQEGNELKSTYYNIRVLGKNTKVGPHLFELKKKDDSFETIKFPTINQYEDTFNNLTLINTSLTIISPLEYNVGSCVICNTYFKSVELTNYSFVVNGLAIS